MKAAIFALAPIALITSLAWADDSMSRVTPTDHQLLKECIERQKTNTNVTLSKADAKRYCKDELRRQKATGEPSEKPPVDAPPAPSDSPVPTQPPAG
jgi:hypothetical protein